MNIDDDGSVWVFAHVCRKIRRKVRADAGRATAVSQVRVLRLAGRDLKSDELEVEVFRSNDWRKAIISTNVVRDDMNEVRATFAAMENAT